MTDGGAADVAVNLGAFETLDAALLERAVRTVLIHEGGTVAEISLTLLDDDGIRDLNARYLGRDRPTDVIAFTLDGATGLLGDVYVGVEQAFRQADELGVDREEELVRLAVHGTLHVLGHDHPEGPDRAASPMFRLQEALVQEVLAGS